MNLSLISLPPPGKKFTRFTVSLEIESKVPKYRAQARIFGESTALYSVKFKGKIKAGNDLYVDIGKKAHISGDHAATIAVTNDKKDLSLRDGGRTEKELISVNVVYNNQIWCYVRGISEFSMPLKGVFKKSEIDQIREEIDFNHSTTHETLINARFLTDQLIDFYAYDQIGPMRLLTVGIFLLQMKNCF